MHVIPIRIEVAQRFEILKLSVSSLGFVGKLVASVELGKHDRVRDDGVLRRYLFLAHIAEVVMVVMVKIITLTLARRENFRRFHCIRHEQFTDFINRD